MENRTNEPINSYKSGCCSSSTFHYYSFAIYLFSSLSLSDFFSLKMSSKMILLFGVPMFVGGCAILWIYWDRLKKPKNKIFISADCWLCVFDLLEPSQLGLGIALISHRFDYYIDEHFKTRKWTLNFMEIGRKFEEHGASNEMEIFNSDWKLMPIPQNPLPKKVVGFEAISINFIDNNVITFLGYFRPLFASNCPINLAIDATSDRILDSIFRNIWPMLGQNIHGLELSTTSFHRLRQIVPSFLNECPLLRIVTFYATADLFPEFPADDNAMASNGQALAKWLFTPLHNNVPKVLRSPLDMNDAFLASEDIEDFKAAFSNASSPVNFIIVIRFPPSFADAVVPFALTNELTREQLALKRTADYHDCFLLVRCPIARDESKWTKWEEEEEAIYWHHYYQWNRIDIEIYSDDHVGDGLLDEIPGPSDQQQ